MVSVEESMSGHTQTEQGHCGPRIRISARLRMLENSAPPFGASSVFAIGVVEIAHDCSRL